MMFFTDLPPVSVVQTDWHPFGTSRNFRHPVNFSDSGEDFSVQSTVSVDVKMIIENLQATDSACAMNSEPSSQAQTNVATKQRSDGMLDRTSISVLKGASVEELKASYPSCTLGTEESNLGHCTLDSDSDESVDRDIEEAIQEYLKKKTEDTSLTSKAAVDTKVLPGTHGAIENSATKVNNGISQGKEGVNPPKLGLDLANVVSLEPAGSRCSSPSSISSNDSFEQSIQAEIERFLQEKRNRETGSNGGPKSQAASVGRTEQKENLVKVGQKKRKRCIKSSAGNQPRPVQQTVINTNSEVGNAKSSQLGKLETVCSTEKGSEENPKSNKNVTNKKKPRSRLRFKELHKSSNTQCDLSAEFTESRANPVTARVELSDSSSDDGIEEAIQLYQLEQKKGKAKDVAFVLGLLPHKSPRSQKYADISSCMKSREKEIPQAAVSKRNSAPKPGQFCPVNLSDTDTSDSDDCITQTERNITNSRLGWKERFQSVTLSVSSPKQERFLMTKVQPSADSILAGAPSEKGEYAGKGKTSSEYTNVASKQVTVSSDSESSSADSSDSIEKEIQNYLALKASQSSQKSNKVGAVSELDRTSQESKREDSLNAFPSLFISLTSSSSQTSMSQNKRLKNNVSSDHELEKEKLKESQPQESSGKALVSTNSTTVTAKINLKGSSSGQDIPDVSNSMTFNRDQEKLSPKDWVGEKQSAVLDSWQTDEKSSSLDSDEDLDTATKDLLQTRKKLGKRSREIKNRCKKRVRFTGAEVLTYSEQSTGIGDQTVRTAGEGLASSHVPLKSCLSKSNKSACRRYLDFKNKGNKKPEEQSEGESHSKMTSIRNLKVGLSCGAAFRSADGPTWQNVTIENSSSADSDDGIEQEILKFLAEKARMNSRLNEHSNDANTVQIFKKQGEESKWSEMAGPGRALSALPQQAEWPCHLEDEPTAGYLQRDMESKTNVNQQDLLQNIDGICSVQSQSEDRQVLGERPATFKTETKAGIVLDNLQVGSIDWHGDVLQDKKVNTSAENIKVETTQSLPCEQSVPYVNSKLLQTVQHKQQPVQIKSSKQTLNKLWNIFQTDPLHETVSANEANGTCRRGQYSRDDQSNLDRGTDQSSQAVVNTLLRVGWAGSATMKSEKGKNQGQPLTSPMPSVSVGAQCGEVSRLPSVAGREQSDHNYQSGVKSEEGEQSDARLTRTNCETQHLCKMSGASSCLPIAEPTIVSTHKESSSVEQKVDSVGAVSVTVTLIAEETSKGEASSKCKSGGTGVTLLSTQCQPLSQTLSGSKIEERNDRGSETEEAAQGSSPEAFYDKASHHSDDDSRVDTDRSGLQRQGAEV
ncbi:protein phosphatase 1 regulatory subunit 26 [Stegostoma tigrinum]|uniref:protein phosphatase 1 regulatory subunit 26 n=1 Tax=Stegostoma tigrinum TaxID=3053191 RepID=UPI00202ACECF|nr:protein phosphatase 1 regulatory subunit 26 [Stegostoma tigrinum]XP_059494244.1 protein phosphatase 1 regulatory subunit 26 [Stegostoma tigrinum]